MALNAEGGWAFRFAALLSIVVATYLGFLGGGLWQESERAQ